MDFIITDEYNLVDKKKMTKDEFYKENSLKAKDSQIKIQDSANTNILKDSKIFNGDYEFYALLSTSDKEINGRYYSKDSLKRWVQDNLWHKNYNKPILKQHNIFSDCLGRMKETFFVDHETFEVISSNADAKLPEGVLKHYQDAHSFEDGTGTVIGRFTTNETIAERILNDLDLTVSQSSLMEKATCSICGHDYFGEKCEHLSGEQYLNKDTKELETCKVTIDCGEPIELSFVNFPANATSTVFAHKKEDASIVFPTHDEETTSGDAQENVKETVVEEIVEEVTKDTEVEKEQIVEEKEVKEEIKDGSDKTEQLNVDALISSLSKIMDEKIQAIVETMKPKEEIEEVQDSAVEETQEEVTEEIIEDEVVEDAEATEEPKEEKTEVVKDETEHLNDLDKFFGTHEEVKKDIKIKDEKMAVLLSHFQYL